LHADTPLEFQRSTPVIAATKRSRHDYRANSSAQNAGERSDTKYDVHDHDTVAINGATDVRIPQQTEDYDQIGHYQPEEKTADSSQKYPRGIDCLTAQVISVTIEPKCT